MKQKRCLLAACALSALSLLYTLAVRLFDRAPIAPDGSDVGLSGWNAAVRDAVGTSELFCRISEALGYLALLVAAGFALLGVVALLRRKMTNGIDPAFFVLAGFYMAVLAVYVLFNVLVINRRPILEDGIAEASYPSSHTILLFCILIGAIPMIFRLIANRRLAVVLSASAALLAWLGAAARFLSGVHWVSDIVGGLLISSALLFWFFFGLLKFAPRKP